MTVRVYQSTDVGAPVLGTTSDGSLITILRACLVDGYGSRTPQGWTMPFSDLPNKLACFQSVSGDIIRVDDNIDYRWATVSGFKTMTDVNTGTEEYPNSVQLGGGYHYRVYKRNSSSAQYDGWIVIASDNWFYYYNIHNETTNSRPSGFFFGQYDCLNPSFTENYIITGQRTTISDTNANQCYIGLFNTSGGYYARRNYQNAENPVELANYTYLDPYANPNPFTGSLELSKMYLRSKDTQPVRYGYLANLHRALGNNNLGYIGGEKFTINSKNYIVLAYSVHAFVIEYDDHAG